MIPSFVLKRKLQSAKEIEEIVSSMKAFANFNVQTAKKSLSNLRFYQSSIEDSFGEIITLFPYLTKKNLSETKKTIFVLFMSQEGLCGYFNEDILNFFENIFQDNSITIIVGAKGAELARARKILCNRYLNGASNVEAIEINAIELSSYLIETFEKEHFNKLNLIYAELEGGSYNIVEKKVLPPDFSKFHKQSIQEEPLLYLQAEDILHALIKEYLHTSIYRAFIESVASENQARLNAMVQASNAIKEREKLLMQELNVHRQQEITDELLDIVNAYRSITK
ncbi:MAG TPA: F0F1 ATP synthase subunit gamma [Sulfurovum sp.]|uniref:F0F1 ATP synthase subunit gamma n=1 Tax=Sulfurovum sp. TaxID=1969726 RepID=UPI002F932C68